MEEVKYVDREKEIGSHIDFSDFLEEMKKFEEAYPNGINFTVCTDSWCDTDDICYAQIKLACESPQTEEEKELELEQAIIDKNRAKEYRRLEYEKLRKEFEGEQK